MTIATRQSSIAGSKDLRPFEPGTMGWTADDLDDPKIEAAWFAGRFEIIEGVLARMAPAYFAGGQAQIELIILLRAHFPSKSNPVRFSTEVDLVLSQRRVVRADAIMMTASDRRKQEKAAVKARRKNTKRTRILVPPTLAIESVSPGHEVHDTNLKLQWYAEFGIPNYWIVDAFAQTLICYRLVDGVYIVDGQGKDSDILKPSAFSPLAIPLASLW